jgi:hypothetical protein
MYSTSLDGNFFFSVVRYASGNIKKWNFPPSFQQCVLYYGYTRGGVSGHTPRPPLTCPWAILSRLRIFCSVCERCINSFTSTHCLLSLVCKTWPEFFVYRSSEDLISKVCKTTYVHFTVSHRFCLIESRR